MRILIRALLLALAAALLMLSALACTSGGTTSSRTNGDLVSAAPLEVLAASGESFEQDVESLQAELVISMNIGGFAVDASSEMTFQAPDQMHATMDLTGLGTFEMLLLGTNLYMTMPGQGWVLISLDDAGLSDLGLDPSMFEDIMTDHSMVDYQELIESIGGEVEDLGEETVDGDTFQHYRAAMDFGDMAGALATPSAPRPSWVWTACAARSRWTSGWTRTRRCRTG